MANKKQTNNKKQPKEKQTNKTNKTNKKKPNIIMSIFILIGIIIIIGVISYYVYDNFIKIKSIDNNNINNKKSLDINKIGEEKFYFLRSQNRVDNHKLLFFTENKILDASNINNNDILAVIYSNIGDENKNITGNSDSNCAVLDQYPSNCYKESFDINILKNQVNNFFTNKININYNNFYPSIYKYCTLNNNNYECILKQSDFKVDMLFTLVSLYETKLEDNNLVLYTGLITVKRNTDGVPEEEKGVYSDSLGLNKIDNLNYFNNLTNGMYSNELTKQLLEHYKNSATKYKTTFVLENNNYVWLKTEIIN